MRGGVYSYETKSGRRWRAVFDTLPDPKTGERRKSQKRGFATKREAESWLRDTLGKVASATYTEPSRVTVGEYLGRWLGGLSVKPTTLANYGQCATVHVAPRLGGVRLQALTPEHLDTLYRQLEKHGKAAGKCRTAGVTCKDHDCSPERHKGLAPKSVRHVHTMLRKALQDAFQRGHVARNVADLSNPPSQKAARSRNAREKAWNRDQLRTFLAHTADEPLAPLWYLVATTGLRRAEALGLRWSELDLDAARLRVSETLTEAGGVSIESEDGKTDAAARSIALDARTVAVLREHRKDQLAARLKVGPAWEESGLVFVDAVGRALRPGQVSRTFTRQARAAGLESVGVHGLRHTYATVSLRAGVSPEVVSKRLGHADVSITLSLYAHVMPGDDEAAASAASAAIFGD